MVAASSLEIGVLKVAVGGLGGMEVVEVVASTLGVLEDCVKAWACRVCKCAGMSVE